MEPTAANTFAMTLGGKERVFKYGFRAFKWLGVNPFREATKYRKLQG